VSSVLSVVSSTGSNKEEFSMVHCSRFAVVVVFGVVAAAVAQTTGPAASEPGAMDPVARVTLTMLQDRKETLKDFQAKVNYDVVHTKTEDREGKLGTVDYLSDPTVGPTFSARFEIDTSDGVPIKKHRQDLVFDGTNVTIIDYAGKTYTRRSVVGPGAKAGDATSLNGGVPLPIVERRGAAADRVECRGGGEEF
jgi:hypothetical protein